MGAGRAACPHPAPHPRGTPAAPRQHVGRAGTPNGVPAPALSDPVSRVPAGPFPPLPVPAQSPRAARCPVKGSWQHAGASPFTPVGGRDAPGTATAEPQNRENRRRSTTLCLEPI
ncbi:hypothetical protein GCM10027160_12530 [Streptomyces calidiresistens]